MIRRLAALLWAAWLAGAGVAQARDAEPPAAPPAEHGRLGDTLRFLAGGATGLALHEGSHVAFDTIFGVGVEVHSVDFHGIPFFALSPDGFPSAKQRYVITSAGFWMQHAGNEFLLTRRPDLRHEHAPFAKGVFAFNVLASVAYGGAALAETGPIERDTLGMAAALRVREPWVVVMVLGPAALDTWRFYHPESRTARWLSRAWKVGLVILTVKAH